MYCIYVIHTYISRCENIIYANILISDDENIF